MLCDECRQREAVENKEYCAICLVATKECRGCHSVKSIFEFEKNQRTPNGVRNRRSECKDCRRERVKPLSPAKRKKFEKENPRPEIGDTFECPVCKRMFTISTNQSINLDHDTETGEVRGWICGDCNTGMGKMRDDISTLARAILWIKQVGKIFN